MTRLIDADSIEYTHAIARSLDDGHNWNELCVTAEEIQDMPTVDAMPVIWCKDCKWFGKSGCAILIVDESDMPKEDDFCSWAERKEE